MWLQATRPLLDGIDIHHTASDVRLLFQTQARAVCGRKEQMQSPPLPGSGAETVAE